MSASVSVDADAVAAAVEALPGVSRLYGGVVGEIATYLPSGRVPGVRVRGGQDADPARLEVHIVVAPGCSPIDTADAVHAAVAPLAGDLEVIVFVDDLEVSGPLAARPALTPGSVGELPAPGSGDAVIAATPAPPAPPATPAPPAPPATPAPPAPAAEGDDAAADRTTATTAEGDHGG